MHLAQNWGDRDRAGRPTAGQQTFFLGPAQRIVGGQLTYAYLDKKPKVKVEKTLDPADILHLFKTGECIFLWQDPSYDGLMVKETASAYILLM